MAGADGNWDNDYVDLGTVPVAPVPTGTNSQQQSGYQFDLFIGLNQVAKPAGQVVIQEVDYLDSTEVVSVTFADLADGERFTIGNLSYTADGATNSLLVAQYFQTEITAGNLDGWEHIRTVGETLVIQSDRHGNVDDIEIGGNADSTTLNADVLSGHIAVISDGTGNTEETVSFHFVDMSAHKTLTIAGETFRADADGANADEVAIYFANIFSQPGGSGGYLSSNADHNTLVLYGNADGDLTDIVLSGNSDYQVLDFDHTGLTAQVVKTQGETIFHDVEIFDLREGTSDRGGYLGTGTSDIQNLWLRLGITFKENTDYRIELRDLQDIWGNLSGNVDNGEFTYFYREFSTGNDDTSPNLSTFNNTSTNEDGGSARAVEEDIRLLSPETLVLNDSGTIILRHSGTSGNTDIVERFDVADAQSANGVITIQGDRWDPNANAGSGSWATGGLLTLNSKIITIDPKFALDYGSSYEIVFVGSPFKDQNGNVAVYGDTNPADNLNGNLDFVTENRLSVINTATDGYKGTTDGTNLDFGLNENIEIRFSEAVTVGNSDCTITLYLKHQGAGIIAETFTASGTKFIGSRSGEITFDGSLMVINPGDALDRAADYYITIGSNASGSAIRVRPNY